MRSQGDDSGIDPLDLIDRFNKAQLRYLLIGSMALSMHDAPFGSADWDFWVSSEDRSKVYEILEQLGLHGEYGDKAIKPMDSFTDDELFKVDIFFVKDFSNRKKRITLRFDDVYRRAVIKKDPQGDFFVRIPALADLVTMLEIVENPRPQHLKHIEYLKVLLDKKRAK